MLIDYANSGLDIQAAMVDQFHRYPTPESRPDYLLWGGLKIKTADQITVPKNGTITATIRSCTATENAQGFDLAPKKGFLRLVDGQEVQLLRTWNDVRYEAEVSYPFFSAVGFISFWNVYKRQWPNGNITEEKWTGNAGFWIEELSPLHRVYHCSTGPLRIPDFEAFVVEILVT